MRVHIENKTKTKRTIPDTIENDADYFDRDVSARMFDAEDMRGAVGDTSTRYGRPQRGGPRQGGSRQAGTRSSGGRRDGMGRYGAGPGNARPADPGVPDPGAGDPGATDLDAADVGPDDLELDDAEPDGFAPDGFASDELGPHDPGADGFASAGVAAAGRRGRNERTETLIRNGRSAPRARRPRARTLVIAGAAVGATTAIVAGLLTVFSPGPSWPASVATVQEQITTACQNPDVVSEPGQVNFACAKATQQVLWVFALLTSGNNPSFTASKSGRIGLEPITPTEGGQLAWSLNLHQPYNPVNPVHSLQVAARAINNIVGGATVTGPKDSVVVEPGLESSPQNCARYTGSSALITRAGYPARCALPVTSSAGQAALVANIYQQWVVGASAVTAQDAGVLFENADNPGDPQVQAILHSMPPSGL